MVIINTIRKYERKEFITGSSNSLGFFLAVKYFLQTICYMNTQYRKQTELLLLKTEADEGACHSPPGPIYHWGLNRLSQYTYFSLVSSVFRACPPEF
jgi:hypothetical protein